MSVSRRTTLKGALALSFTVSGSKIWLSPSEARSARADLRILTPKEVRTLERLGDVLLPGARTAGIAYFIDHQLAAPAADCLLMLRYLDVPPPYVDFYRAGLSALDASSSAAHGLSFAELHDSDAEGLVGTLGVKPPTTWQGPPAPLFYFVTRSDAVDVVYGTPEGFERLGVPYMPHIMPTQKW